MAAEGAGEAPAAGEPLLDPVCVHPEPWAAITCEPALGPTRCSELEALFSEPWTWEQHRTFYEAAIAVVPDALAPPWLDALRDRVAALSGVPLAGPVRVTLQIMAPGQFARVHSDRPLLGYESLRLIVQLNRDWAPGDGGEFHVHAHPDGPPVAVWPPRHDSAVCFALHPGSLHAVAPTRVERRTVVFHFHHLGNSLALADAVRGLCGDMAFGALPGDLDDPIRHAEQQHPEDASYRACATAWVLWRWGCPPGLQARGLAAGLPETLDLSAPSPVLLAAWAARLHAEPVDLGLWGRLQAVLRERPPSEGPVADFRALAFPPG